ncbi:MAG TPA: zinc-ribbon domain-containing protein [Planctomycetota bacterium]|nr:zinc-ribbon domain-containing protein [Planctomycetota bacterium]
MKESAPCPHCGAPVPARAKSCRECGSDARTGWAPEERIGSESVDLPEPELDPEEYGAFLRREGLAGRKRRIGRVGFLLLLGAAILLLILALR